MKNYGLKYVLSLMILLSALSLYAGESKGYKIVLASFGSFDEAKGALAKIGEKLGDEEKSLQSKQKFEIVARPSGKAYILAIEPIESEAGSKDVLKQFKKLYPGAYINGYFGPTSGSVSLQPETKAAVDEVNTTQESTITTVPVEKNVTKAIETPKERVVVSTQEEENPKTTNPLIYVIILLLVIVPSVLYLRKRVFSAVANHDEGNSLEYDNEADSKPVELAQIDTDTVSSIERVPYFETSIEVSKDIFYTFKKNMFFITLLSELRSAAQNKESGRCNEIMDEILRYQKNFQKSEMMASMKELLDGKELEKLAALIGSEIE